MRTRLTSLAMSTLACLLLAPPLCAQTVTNVRAQQLTDGTKRVEILYDLSGAAAEGAAVTVAISSDGGATYAIAPAAGSLAGDVAGVASGANRRIVWDPAASVPAGSYGTNYRAAVTASSPPASTWPMVLNRGGEPWVAAIDGSRAERLAAVTLRSNPSISNGRVAFALADYAGQGPGVYVMPAIPGAPLTKLAGSEVISARQGIGSELSLSPDGLRVVYSGADPGDYYWNLDLYVQDVDGSGLARISRTPSHHHLMPSWGEMNRILYSRMNVGSAYTQYPFRIAPDGTGKSQFNSTFTQFCRSRGEGNAIVASLGHSGNEHLVVFDANLLNGVSIPGAKRLTFPFWHPTENVVYAVHSSIRDVYRIEVTTGLQTRITHFGDVLAMSLDMLGVAP